MNTKRGVLRLSILASFQTEHDAIWRAADQWASGEMADAAFVEALGELVRVHFRDEEAILFPELNPGPVSLDPVKDAALAERLESYLEEHRRIAAVVEAAVRLINTAPAGTAPDGAANEARQLLVKAWGLVRRHIEEEEAGIFPEAEARLGLERLRRLQGRRQECSCGGH